ncbi:helix-turn-helix domain-containing protein [Desulfothermus sp.]
MEKLYTIKELSSILNVPESTLRYYRDRFEEFIPVVGKGRKRRYKKESIEIFKQIIKGYEEDLTTKQIRNNLLKKLSKKDSEPEINKDQLQQILEKQSQILDLLAEDIRSKKDFEKELDNLKTRLKKIEKALIKLISNYKHFKKQLDKYIDISHNNKEIL